MIYNFLTINGTIETHTLKEIKKRTNKNISWAKMNELNDHTCTTAQDKKDYDYLKKYLGKVTIFDWNNFKEYGYLHLYPHFQELAIKNGAEDKRTKKEV